MFERRRLRVYVAGPMFSQGDPYENVQRGITVSRRMVSDGLAPFVPHTDAFMYFGNLDWQTALEWDLEWVATSEAVYRLRGDSKGADLEVGLAKKLKIPVFYESRGDYEVMLEFAKRRDLRSEHAS